MNKEVFRIHVLKRVLGSAGQGAGLSRSIVTALRGTDALGDEASRLLLLGVPVASAMEHFIEGSSDEVSMLASLIVAAPRSSTPLVGQSGGAVAITLERWVKAKENEMLEEKVMRFRGMVTSGVLGAVAAMLASLGPLVGSLNFAGTPDPGGGALIYAAAAMTAIGSGMLGIFMSGRGFYVNILVSLAAFAVVSAVASPLAAVPSVALWGVK